MKTGKVFIVFIITLALMASSAWGVTYFNLYGRTGRTGGTASDLDGISTSGLQDGHISIVPTGDKVYFYEVDDDSAAAESDPIVIKPDNEIGDLRHVLMRPMFGDTNIGNGRVVINGDANENGITIGNLGTATRGIDFSSSGLATGSDYFLYMSASQYWNADSVIRAKNFSFDQSGGAVQDSSGYSTIYMSGTDALELRTGYWADIRFNTGYHAAQPGNTIIRTTATSTALIGNYASLGLWAGDGVSNGTATITDVGGAAHGLSLAAGDLVHIGDSSTAADEGYYRIVSDDGTNVVLDRALAGSDTDLRVKFYKDVIGFFATDGTNGQRITGYSHQDKPLQIGGDTQAATNRGLGAEDVLFDGIVEFNKTVAFDGAVQSSNFSGTGAASNNGMFPYGSNDGVFIRTTTDSPVTIYTPDNQTIRFEASGNRAVLIGDRTPIGRWVGDGVSNGTATITDVGGAAHGLSLAAGDLVHIRDATTAADEGYYRIVSDDGTNVVLDRALAGSDADLTVEFFQDVVYFGATDGTNGQRIMNYSHQDKPLQIGGDMLTATSHNLGGEDVLIAGNLVEIDPPTYHDSRVVNATATLSAAGPTDNLDVSGANILFIDSNGNNVTLGGMTGGVSGQVLQVVVVDASNNASLENAEATGNQDIFLDSGGDETLTASYGGWTLICNGTHWYEIDI